MATKVKDTGNPSELARAYPDLHDHIEALDRAGLLQTVDEPIDKDSEMHPLVRWQFQGGLAESERKAFLFRNIVDGKGRKFDIPVVVCALAASQDVYSVGMGAPVSEIGQKWADSIANPIEPNFVSDNAPCHDVVITGDDLLGEGNGLDMLPIPVSTPGFDSAPTLTSTNTITRDPDTDIHNMGTYRAALKAPDRLVVRMATRVGGAGGYQHWRKHKARGEKLPCAIVLGCPPSVAYMGPQKLPLDVDEVGVAGALAGSAINLVKAKTVDLMVPAEAEIVIEGLVDTEYQEPEGPFGESHGHVALEEYNLSMQVTAITHRRKPIITSYLSQVAPSESSVMKRVAYEPLFLTHLRDHLGIKGVSKVSLHEKLTGLLRVTIVSVDRSMPRTEIWRALYGAASFKGDCSKICIAVNDDIDPDNADALLWALAYRSNPVDDVKALPHRGQGHGPKREHGGEEDSSLLIDATMKSPMPPLALPTQPYMEKAKTIWDKLGLPAIKPESPWFGYSLGDWTDAWEEAAKRCADGDYLENGRRTNQRRRKDIFPETSVRDVEDGWD
ncbi:MAG: UbiD family decarboxylase [Pseudomonadota bacterium]|nr:UbiD family decarboxylase [Pseudomonadota bacterium]